MLPNEISVTEDGKSFDVVGVPPDVAVAGFSSDMNPPGPHVKQLALRAAADVPLEVMRLSALGLKQAQTVAWHGCRAASSDMQLAVALLRVGLVGARTNLELKLSSLTDEAFTQAVVHEIARLNEDGEAAANAAEASLRALPA